MCGRVDALLWESILVNSCRADLAEVQREGIGASGRVISVVSGMRKVEALAEWRAEAGNHPGEAIRHRRLRQPTLLTQREAH